MLLGTVVFSQIFGHFMQPDAVFQSPDVAMYVAAGVLALALGLFVATVRAHPQARGAGAE
jgi:DHA1 family tetracycline resistance protein-like MFS transporter